MLTWSKPCRTIPHVHGVYWIALESTRVSTNRPQAASGTHDRKGGKGEEGRAVIMRWCLAWNQHGRKINLFWLHFPCLLRLFSYWILKMYETFYEDTLKFLHWLISMKSFIKLGINSTHFPKYHPTCRWSFERDDLHASGKREPCLPKSSPVVFPYTYSIPVVGEHETSSPTARTNLQLCTEFVEIWLPCDSYHAFFRKDSMCGATTPVRRDILLTLTCHHQ